jgi:hypothetical protein
MDKQSLIRTLASNSIMLSMDEQETLWDITQRCARHAGVPMGGATAVAMASVGSVAIPGVGAVPGWLLGFLVGAASGTTMCVIMNYGVRDEIVQLIRDARHGGF